MAHRTTHRRNLPAPDPETSMDSTHKKEPKFTAVTTTVTSTTNRHHRHPTDPDPTVSSSTLHTISKHFSKLYSNRHKVLAPSKSANPLSKPRIDTNLQAKAMAISATESDSVKSIAKSNRHCRKTVAEIEKERLRAAITGVFENDSRKESRDGDDIRGSFVNGRTEKLKKLSKKGSAKKESHEEGGDGLKEDHDGNAMKRPSISLVVAVGSGGGRRRSFGSSQTEMANFFSCNGVKVVATDMPPFMQVHAVDSARKAHDSLENFTSRSLASTLKKEFDGVYGPAWHCIVGTNFGSFVTHSVGGFLYFSMDHKLYILLFKTTVQRAD